LTQDIRNPITPLQEICRKRHWKPPRYVYTQISSAPLDPVFRVEMYVNDEKVAEAKGRSKKEAKRKPAHRHKPRSSYGAMTRETQRRKNSAYHRLPMIAAKKSSHLHEHGLHTYVPELFP